MRSEHWLYSLPLRLRSLFNRKQVEHELDDELQFHLEQRIEAEVAQGRTPSDARNIALRAMQGLEQKKEECRDMRRVNLVENLGRDVRYALRMLRRSPAFTAVAILSLALGIGANTAIFSLLDTLVLRPLPVPQPRQLVQIQLQMKGRHAQSALTHPIFEELRKHVDIFSGLMAWSDHRFQMRSSSEMVHINGVLAGGDYFQTLGVPAAIGRTFTAAEDAPGGGKSGPVAVISDAFWSSRFRRDPAVLGSTLTLDGVNLTVTGVMPRQFFGADVSARPDVWVPLGLTPQLLNDGCYNSRSCWWLFAMARLRPHSSLQNTQAELQVISPRVFTTTLPENWDAGEKERYKQMQIEAYPAPSGWSFLRVRLEDPLAILMTLVGIVLLIACANMANLLFARSSARQREIAVRLAMGAGRSRIIRQLLTESLLLSLFGGIAGLAFAVAANRILLAFLTEKPNVGPLGQDLRFDLNLDWRILLFTFSAAVFSGLLFGLAPALRATRLGISGSLKERAQAVRGTGVRIGAGRLILNFQAALSILLVCVAGLFAGSLWRLWTLDPGFNPKDLVVVGIDSDRYAKSQDLMNIYSRVLERANAIPGVQAASLLWITPLSGGGWDENLAVPGRPPLPADKTDTFINLVAPRFFETMGIPLRSGREFTRADNAKSERVGIINELAARRFFGDQNPVGAQVRLENELIRIIGVSRNTRYLDMRSPEPLELYIPFTQKSDGTPSMSFVVRSGLKAGSVESSFRKILHQIAPDIPLYKAGTMIDHVAASLDSERLMASLSLFFGTLALLLTSIGLYGVLAYSVARRTNEIGVRMALGAQRFDVMLIVMRESMLHVAIGIGVGIAAVLATSKLVASLLYGVTPNDVGNLALAVTIFLLVAGTAAYLPARRASFLEPVLALREE